MRCYFLLQGIFSPQGSPALQVDSSPSEPLERTWGISNTGWINCNLFNFALKQYNPQASLYPQMVKNLPADAGGPYSIPRDDPLDKGMAIHSSILAWRIPWTERSLADCSRKQSDTTEHTPQALHYLSGLISWCSKNTSSCFSISVFVYPAFSTSVSRKATWTLKFKWYLTQKSSANVFWLRFAFTLNFSFVFWHLYSASKYRLEFLSYPCQTTRTFWTSTIPYFWSSGGPNISFAQGTGEGCPVLLRRQVLHLVV